MCLVGQELSFAVPTMEVRPGIRWVLSGWIPYTKRQSLVDN